jgi:hypothetical protein
MPRKLPLSDPSTAYKRKSTAQRRVGEGSQCACGEKRPEALVAGSTPIMCAACSRRKKGHTTMDDHHFAGKANNPTTIPVPVNDHRAELNVAQYDWPRETRENPDGSPLLAGAACVRGFADTVVYLIYSGLLWVAEMLEKLNALLAKQMGPQWWANTEIEQFAPKG